MKILFLLACVVGLSGCVAYPDGYVGYSNAVVETPVYVNPYIYGRREPFRHGWYPGFHGNYRHRW